MALILGHYERLVTAISHVDTTLIGLVRQGKFVEAMKHMDFRFLAAVGLGMASGILALASLMHYLLEHHLEYTYAVFSGMILVSSYLVARRLGSWNWATGIWTVIGAVFAWQVCLQQPLHGELTPMSAFLCASVAICAMILPGISGAFVLLLLGVYHPVTELLKGLPKGQVTFDGLVIIASFVLGCLAGLLAFSRVLRWLLTNKHDATLACLVGLMIGSLYKIWPFQQATEETAGLPFKEQQFQHLWPAESSASGFAVVGLALVAAVGTWMLEQLGTRLSAGHDDAH